MATTKRDTTDETRAEAQAQAEASPKGAGITIQSAEKIGTYTIRIAWTNARGEAHTDHDNVASLHQRRALLAGTDSDLARQQMEVIDAKLAAIDAAGIEQRPGNAPPSPTT